MAVEREGSLTRFPCDGVLPGNKRCRVNYEGVDGFHSAWEEAKVHGWVNAMGFVNNISAWMHYCKTCKKELKASDSEVSSLLPGDIKTLWKGSGCDDCRGTGLLLGSVSTGLVHHSSCPVAVIRPEPAPADGDAPVLLGIDGSPASEAATTLAFDEASRRGVGLVALHAWSDVAVFPVLGMDSLEVFAECGVTALARSNWVR